MAQITIKRPDDWHVHLREGEMLRKVLPFHAEVFGRFVAMPNLSTPLTSRILAKQYAEEICRIYPNAQPLVPCYLTEDSCADELIAGHEAGDFFGAKFYPVGATTQSHAGVKNIEKLYPLFEQMQKYSIPLLMHGEVVDPEVDIYDRERVFVETSLTDLVAEFPELVMTMEHLTTKDAVDFVADHHGCSRLAGSITLHHMILNRNDMLNDGLRADYFCYPLVKSRSDCQAVRKAAVSGQACYFLGTDSAPHPIDQKYASVAKAGIFTAPVAIQGYAAVFEAENSLDKFEAFASVNGAQHYGFSINDETISLSKKAKAEYPKTVDDLVTIFDAATDWVIDG